MNTEIEFLPESSETIWQNITFSDQCEQGKTSES